jgi:hypothetical protein
VEPIIAAPPGTNGPWRLLILDRDPADPKWILATVTSPADVTPADLAALLTNRDGITAWVRAQLGRPDATLVPMTRAHVWHIDEDPPGNE